MELLRLLTTKPMPPHATGWSFDAKQCKRILFRVSDFLIYASFVILGQSYLHALRGYYLEWRRELNTGWDDPSSMWESPPAAPSYAGLAGGVDSFALEPGNAQKVVFGPDDPPQDVSGQYGPGVYASWLLVMLSSMVSAIITPPDTPDQHRARVDADILTTNIYAIVAAADLVYRTYRYSSTTWGASYLSAGQVVWNAWIFSIATIGPNRNKPLNSRLRVQYIALWVFTVSQALTRRYLFGDPCGWRGSEYVPIYTSWPPRNSATVTIPENVPKYAPQALRNFVTVTIPLAIYYRWSAAIPFRFVRLLTGIVFVLWYTHGTIFIEHLWIFRTLPVGDLATWRFRVLFPQARSEIKELDQAVALVTTVIILLWQWKVLNLGLKAIRYAKNSRLRTQSVGGDALVELEDITAVV